MMMTSLITLADVAAGSPWPLGTASGDSRAWAVNDLARRPGGQPATTCTRRSPAIARDQQLAAQLHAGHLPGDLHRRVRRDVLFDLQAPQVEGRAGRPTSTRAPTVEIAWTVVPFIIVILMALPATTGRGRDEGHQRRRPDRSRPPAIQWKWGYDYLKGEGEGIGFLSTLDVAQREMSDAGKPSGDDYLLKVDNPLVGAGRQEGPHHHHRQRRDPRLHGAVVRRQAGRDPRLRARHLVPRRRRPATSTASAPSCAARSTPTCRST